MLRHALILGGLLFGVLGPALPGIAADSRQARGQAGPTPGPTPAAPTSRSALAGIPELDKPVSYAEEKIALSDLVAKVTVDTGVLLTAHKDVADEPVAVYVKELPARELLEQLADLLDYRWSRRAVGQVVSLPGSNRRQADSRPHFEIWQDLASKQREEALRQGNYGEAVKRIRAELARYVAVAALPEEQVLALAAAGDERERARQFAIPKQGTPPTPTAEESARRDRELAARRLKSPITRALASLLGSLTPEQWSMISAKGSLSFSSSPAFNEDQLPPQLAQACRTSRPTLLRPPSPDPDVPKLDPEVMELMQKQERLTQERWAAATGFRAQVRLQVGSGIGGAVTLSAAVVPLRSGTQGSDGMFFSNETDLTIVALPQSRWSLSSDSMEKERERAEADPVLGKRITFTSGAKPRQPRYGASRTPQWRLFDLMPDLARAYGVQFIADAYSTSAFSLTDQSAAFAPTTLYQQLTRYGGGRLIDRKGNLVRLRSRTWFLDRLQEIPLRLVNRWQSLFRERGALPFDEYLTMASALSDEQVKALPHLIAEAGLPRDLLQMPPARQMLRLVASLSTDQRRALWHGAVLPVAGLSEPQRRLFYSALQQIDHDSQRVLHLGQWTGGSLAVSLGDRTERLLPSRSAIVPDGVAADPAGIAATTRTGSTGILPSDAGAGPPGPASSTLGAQPETGERCSVVQVRLHLQYAPNSTETLTLTVSP